MITGEVMKCPRLCKFLSDQTGVDILNVQLPSAGSLSEEYLCDRNIKNGRELRILRKIYGIKYIMERLKIDIPSNSEPITINFDITLIHWIVNSRMIFMHREQRCGVL
jgi:hypothetical protein